MVTMVRDEFASLGACFDHPGSFWELLPYAIDLYGQKFCGSTHNLESILPCRGAILCGAGRKFLRKLGDNTLSRPRARLAKSAKRPARERICDAAYHSRLA